MVGEEVNKQALNARIAVHDPYPLAARLRRGWLVRNVQQRLFLGARRMPGERDGQLDAESAPLSLDRLHFDGAAHAGDEVLDDAQPKACALFWPSERLVRLSEGLEKRAPEACGYADARVAHLKDDLAGLAQANDYANVALLAELLSVREELFATSSAPRKWTRLAGKLTFMST